MSTYILLGTFTAQGAKNIKETIHRVEGIRELAKSLGITVRDAYWTHGQFDTALIVDAPSEAALTAFGLSIGAQGNVHTQTLRAFTEEEMRKILEHVK